jgi:hypothetical protein
MTPEPIRPSRRSAKGQAMAIFALVSVLLFVVAGLAVDAGTSYLTSNRVERAAAAAALAGVAYLPGDQADAQNAALVEAARDGFANAGSGGGTTCTPANSYPCVLTTFPATNKMTVQITVQVSTIFLRIVGFGSHLVVRSETAEYLPPISLGQPGSQQGSALQAAGCIGLANYCSSPSSGLGSSGNYYFEREEGWGNPRSEGDPFTPSPDESSNGCGPSGTDPCTADASPDYHQISAEANTVTPDATLNYQGGSNYLIAVPAGQSADVQIFNPAFAPDTCGDSTTGQYCFHENDGSFDGASAPYTDYSAMEYTLYQVGTLSSRSADTKVSQEVFYPYDATCLSVAAGTSPCPASPAHSYTYFPHCGACTPTATVVNSTTGPSTYHQWVSAINYAPVSGGDTALFSHQFANTLGGSGYLTNCGGCVTKYFRLEVDTVQWNGNPTCAANVGPCAYITTGTDTASEAHKGYAVRLISDVGSPSPITLGTITPAAAAGCGSCGTVSAMDDMTLYTPVNGATATQFSIPLFNVDASYAGQTLNIDLFDIGDVGGGPAYVGLQEPDGVTWAPETSMSDLGASLGGASPPSGGSNVSSLGTWPGGGSCSACFQTASSGGGAIYQGQWVQIQMQVPQSFTAGYWNLVYDVSAAAVAGDTFGVEVSFNGTPDHLLP